MIFIHMRIIVTESQYKQIITEVKAKAEDRDKIYEDERIVVVAPLTHRGSCKYGAFTKWCTATPSNDENFNEYFKNGILVYFIIRTPYQEANVKEYKFAYYHSYTEEMRYADGWYDMSDYNFNDSKGENDADFKLIKFLIPDFVFNKVKEYIKAKKPSFIKKQKETKSGFATLIKRDPDNLMHVIVNDDKWLIFFRLKPLEGEYTKYINWSPTVNYDRELTVFYLNKQNNEFYYQEIPYSIDISGGLSSDIPQFRIMDIETGADMGKSMYDIFMKYYNEIAKDYYHLRKISKFNNLVIYIKPEFLKPGDIYGICQDGNEIVSVKKQGVEYNISYKTKEGKVSNNAYYNKEWGAQICYDKNKYNDINYYK